MKKNGLIFEVLGNDSEYCSQATALFEAVLPNSPKFNSAKESSLEEIVYFAGFLDGNFCASALLIKEDDKFFIKKITVGQEFQGKGIGSMLLRFCEEFAAENEVRVIYSCVRDSIGRSAVNFFTKNEYFCAEEEVVEDGFFCKMMWKMLELGS